MKYEKKQVLIVSWLRRLVERSWRRMRVCTRSTHWLRLRRPPREHSRAVRGGPHGDRAQVSGEGHAESWIGFDLSFHRKVGDICRKFCCWKGTTAISGNSHLSLLLAPVSFFDMASVRTCRPGDARRSSLNVLLEVGLTTATWLPAHPLMLGHLDLGGSWRPFFFAGLCAP